MTWSTSHLAISSLILYFFTGKKVRKELKENPVLFFILSLGGIVPDLDLFLPIHRTWSHSFLFPFSVMFIVLILQRYTDLNEARLRHVKLFAFLWLTHIFLDITYGPMPLFYPLDNRYYDISMGLIFDLTGNSLFSITIAGLFITTVITDPIAGVQVFFINWTAEERISYFGSDRLNFPIANFFLHATVFIWYLWFVAVPFLKEILIRIKYYDDPYEKSVDIEYESVCKTNLSSRIIDFKNQKARLSDQLTEFADNPVPLNLVQIPIAKKEIIKSVEEKNVKIHRVYVFLILRIQAIFRGVVSLNDKIMSRFHKLRNMRKDWQLLVVVLLLISASYYTGIHAGENWTDTDSSSSQIYVTSENLKFVGRQNYIVPEGTSVDIQYSLLMSDIPYEGFVMKIDSSISNDIIANISDLINQFGDDNITRTEMEDEYFAYIAMYIVSPDYCLISNISGASWNYTITEETTFLYGFYSWNTSLSYIKSFQVDSAWTFDRSGYYTASAIAMWIFIAIFTIELVYPVLEKRLILRRD